MKALHQKRIRNIFIGRQGSQSSQRNLAWGGGLYDLISQGHCYSAFLTAKAEFLWDFNLVHIVRIFHMYCSCEVTQTIPSFWAGETLK